MRKLAVIVLVALALPAATARATTAPDGLNAVRVTLTPGKIVIPRDKYSKTSAASRFPRGAQVNLAVHNHTGKTATFRLRLTSNLHRISGVTLQRIRSTGPIPKDRMRHLRLNFFYRAKFVFEMVVGGRVVARHPLTIF